MNFDELSRTLSDALATGKAGVPVSVRLHLQIPDPQADLSALLARAAAMIEQTCRFQPATLAASRDQADRQLSVLATCHGGQTLLVTVGRGSVKCPSLELLLMGNHGVIRLEGGEWFDPSGGFDLSSTDSNLRNEWEAAVTRSLELAAAVPLAEAGVTLP